MRWSGTLEFLTRILMYLINSSVRARSTTHGLRYTAPWHHTALERENSAPKLEREISAPGPLSFSCRDSLLEREICAPGPLLLSRGDSL